MKRYIQLGLIGLVATATVIAAPFTLAPANAQNMPRLEALNLTDDQRSQVQEIFQTLRNDMDGILSDQQQAQLRATYRELQDVREAIAEIDNLTDDQKAQIRTALQSTREDISQVLTPEQQAQLRSIRQGRRQDRR